MKNSLIIFIVAVFCTSLVCCRTGFVTTALIQGKKKGNSPVSSKKPLNNIGKEKKSSVTEKNVEVNNNIKAIDPTRNVEVISILIQMIGSIFALRLNYKSKITMRLARLTFSAYIIFSSVIFWLLERKINASNDSSKVAVPPTPKLPTNLPFGDIFSSGQHSKPPPKEVTVRHYDLEEVEKQSFSLLRDILLATYLHFVCKQVGSWFGGWEGLQTPSRAYSSSFLFVDMSRYSRDLAAWRSTFTIHSVCSSQSNPNLQLQNTQNLHSHRQCQFQ